MAEKHLLLSDHSETETYQTNACQPGLLPKINGKRIRRAEIKFYINKLEILNFHVSWQGHYSTLG